MATQKDPTIFGFQNFYSGLLTADITSGSLTISLDTVPSPSSGILVIDPDSTTGREVILYTSKGASTITCPSDGRGWAGSTASAHLTGTTVIMAPVDEFFEGLQDGTLVSDALRSLLNGSTYFIVSGGTVAQSSGLIGTFSNIVFYINGRRYSGSSIANKTYTASKDTYVDITGNSDGSVTVAYNEVANGAAAPSLAANYLRVAKVVTSGAAITSVVQSHIDSLGNLIYPEMAGTKRVDANGWTVYNMGSWREYRKTITWSQALTSGSPVYLSTSSNNMPVGMSTLSTCVMSNTHSGNGNSGDVLIVEEMTTSATVMTFVVKSTGTATYSGTIHMHIATR